MSLLPEISGPCERCLVHDAEVYHTDSVMSYVHGVYRTLCTCCSLELAIEEIEEQAVRLPELRRNLLVACTDQPARSNEELVSENDRLRRELGRTWQMAHSFVCGRRYPGTAMNDPDPHRDGSQCYYPRPEVLK